MILYLLQQPPFNDPNNQKLFARQQLPLNDQYNPLLKFPSII